MPQRVNIDTSFFGGYIEQLREIRDKLNDEMKEMSPEQVKEFLKKKKTLHPAEKWSQSKEETR